MTSLQRHIILPGQFVITSAPSLISTVLGSCVSVCLWDKTTGIGGMNHYLLPGKTGEDPGNSNRGISSIQMLIRSMLNRQANPVDIEAKIFGGCNSLYRKIDQYRIGERNIAVALSVLEAFNIRVSAQHVGGMYGRKIVFNTTTGKVRMRLLGKTASEINEEINKGLGN